MSSPPRRNVPARQCRLQLGGLLRLGSPTHQMEADADDEQSESDCGRDGDEGHPALLRSLTRRTPDHVVRSRAEKPGPASAVSASDGR